MSYVAVAPLGREARLALAADRWRALADRRPDLRAAVSLQERLVHTLLDLSHVIELGRLPRLSLPARYVCAKLARGVPVLVAEPIPIPVGALKPFLVRFCRELEAGGAGEPAIHLRAAIEESRVDAGSLLSASLARDQRSIHTGSTHLGLAPDLVWLIAELAVSPFAEALQRTLLVASRHSGLAAALDRWPCGFCPACGSWPALGEVLAGRCLLRCSFCTAAWAPPTASCPYCAAGGEARDTTAPLPDHPHHRLVVCRQCGGYLKTVEVGTLSPFPLLALADLETMDLDVAAMQQGFHRPTLRTFGPAAATAPSSHRGELGS